MKVNLLAENLNQALGVVSRGLSSRAQLPVLANVLMRAEKSGLELLSTDLEMSFRAKTGAKVEETGEVSVPGKILVDLVATLSAGVVELAAKEEVLEIKEAGMKAQLATIAAGEFPSIPEFKGKADVEVSRAELVEAISKVGFAAARDDTRPVLTGILWSFAKNKVKLVATDGYRLSLGELRLLSQTKEEMEQVVLPARAVLELVRIVEKETGPEKVEIKLETEKQQVIFRWGQVELISRLLAGEFPVYEQILPTAWTTRTRLNRGELLEAVRRAAIFAKESANIVKLEVAEGTVKVSANNPQLGRNETTLEAEVEGEGLKAAFNSRYLLEYLGGESEEDLILETEGSLKPGVFKTKKKGFLHVIMPVRVQE